MVPMRSLFKNPTLARLASPLLLLLLAGFFSSCECDPDPELQINFRGFSPAEVDSVYMMVADHADPKRVFRTQLLQNKYQHSSEFTISLKLIKTEQYLIRSRHPNFRYAIGAIQVVGESECDPPKHTYYRINGEPYTLKSSRDQIIINK